MAGFRCDLGSWLATNAAAAIFAPRSRAAGLLDAPPMNATSISILPPTSLVRIGRKIVAPIDFFRSTASREPGCTSRDLIAISRSTSQNKPSRALLRY